MKRNIVTVLSMVVVMAGFGCDDSSSGSEDLYSIDENLSNSAVRVTLDEDGTALISLDLSEELPSDADGDLSALLGEAIDVTLVDSDLRVSVSLSGDGSLVSGTPEDDGEYRVGVDVGDRSRINIHFFNLANGHSLKVDGNYIATITVSENDFFVEETFTRDAAVRAK